MTDPGRTLGQRVLIAILSIVSIRVVADEPVVKGRLCFIAGKEMVDVSRCGEVQGMRVEVEPSAEERRFAWLRSDGTQLIVAGLEPQATVIDLDRVKGTIRLRVMGDVSRGWPASTDVTVGETSGKWPLALSGEVASQLREIRVSEGTYELRAGAEHHQPRIVSKIVAGAKPVDLGTITLFARPRFLALVKREDGTPLGGATLVDDFGKLLTKADPFGQLTYEAACEKTCILPGRVSIEYPGLAATRALITDPKRDFDAGSITLGIGGILELTIKRPEDETFPVKVRVIEAADQRGEEGTPRVIVEAVMDADSDHLRLERLPAGKSALYLYGTEATHVLSRYVTIEVEKVTSTNVTIRPTEVMIHVTKGGTGVSGAEVSVGVPHGSPDYDVALPPTNADGRVPATLWQDGTMVATASVGTISETVFFKTGKAPREELEIRISPTRLHGRVYDGDTGKPLKNTGVGYNWTDGNGAQMSSVLTDEHGHYEVQGARTGVHTLQLELPDYLPAESKVETTGGENERVLDLALTRGLEHKVRLQWNDGSPIRGARIIQVIESTERYRFWTSDGAGELTVHLEKDQAIELWIVPVEGSFASATVSRALPSTVRLAPATGALVVKTVDPSGKAMPSCHLGVRYQGRTLDYMILGVITSVQGSRLRTGSNGTTILRGFPAGQYDLWALQHEGDDLSMSEPRALPVLSFYHPGGEQQVTVEADRFDPNG